MVNASGLVREPLFEAGLEKLAANWRDNPVVTGERAFQKFPSELRVAFRAARHRLTARDRVQIDLPQISGMSGPEWMSDQDGNLVVVKSNAKAFDYYASAPREKIAADLAYDLGVPAAPVQLWETKNFFGETVFKIVSLRVVLDSQSGPVERLLIKDRNAPLIFSHDQLVLNDNRKPDSVLHGSLRAKQHGHIGVDWGQSLASDPRGLRQPTYNGEYFRFREAYALDTFGQSVVESLKDGVRTSPVVAAYIDRVHDLSDEHLRAVVTRLPVSAFECLSAPRILTDALPYRRDHLPSLLRQGLGLRP